MSQIRPPNIDEIKRQSVVRFLAEMQDLKQKVELEFSSRLDEQLNNFFASSKSSYSPQDIGSLFEALKSIEMDYMKQILTNTSGNGSKILGNTLSSALTGNLTFSGEATQRIAELEQENTRLKAELMEKDKAFSMEKARIAERGEDQIGELNRLQEMVDEQKRTIEMYEKQAMEHGETLALQRIEIEELQTQVGELSQAQDHADSIVKEKEEIIQEQEKAMAALKEQMTSMDKRIQQMKMVSAEKYEAETGRLENTLTLERERADELEVRLKEASTAVNSYKSAIQQKDDEIDKLRKSITDSKAILASAESEKEAKIRSLQDEKKALDHELTDLKKTFERTEKKVESLTAEVEQKNRLIDERENEISKIKTQLLDVKESIADSKTLQEEKLQDLLKEKTKYEMEINELKKQNRDFKSMMDEKEKTVTSVSKTQEAIERDRDALQQERDKLMVQLENIKTRNAELEKTNAQKETLVKSLTKSLQGVPKYRILIAIQDIGGDISLQDLSKIVGQTPEVVEHIIADLKEEGLVKVAKKENKTFVSKV